MAMRIIPAMARQLTIQDGYVDVLVHWRLTPWKPWLVRFEVYADSLPTTVLVRRFWTKSDAMTAAVDAVHTIAAADGR